MSRLQAADSQKKMVRRCCVCGEKKDKEAADSQIRFFRIPSAKSSLFNQWAAAIKALKNKPSDRLKKNSIVCSKHFEKSCFYTKENTVKLKQGSLPTLYDPSVCNNKNDTSPTEHDESIESTDIPDNESTSGNGQKPATSHSEQDAETSSSTRNKAEQPQDDRVSHGGERASEGSSESLSPPSLQPMIEVNSDYEENVEEPPDLEMYSMGNDCDGAAFLTDLSEFDAIKADHIGSVADILGPDFLPEESIRREAERSEASSKAEVVEVDGQTFLSFASAEDLEEYVNHSEPTHQLAKPNDNTIDNIVKLCQPTPSLTPSPCSSPFPSSQTNLLPDTTTTASGTSSVDANSDTNRRSPVPNLSEDFTLPDQEVCNIMESERLKTNAEKTSNDADDSNPASSEPVSQEEQKNANELAEEQQNTLRYSESDDSMSEAVEAERVEEKDPIKFETDSDGVGKRTESKAHPELKTDGTITPEVAAFAVSAITLSPQAVPAPSATKSTSVAPKRVNVASRGRRAGPASATNRQGKRTEPPIFDKSAPSDEIDEILNVDMSTKETAFEDLVVLEEKYTEVYDVPVKSEAAVSACGQLACRLGCICASLHEAGSRRKQPSEHCSLQDCMLECVCGFKRGKVTGRRSFITLLKGNESFYSKINWTNERSRRERKVPERYSEYQLETETIKQPNTGRGSGSRANSRPASPTYKPPSSAGRQHQPRSAPRNPEVIPARVQQNQPPQIQAAQTTPIISPKRKESFKLKIAADEIKLLRWDSYVSLSKVYVAPDQEVMCMEHKTYSCPCIASNRRIIRIPLKFVPPEVRIAEGTKAASQGSGAKPVNGSRNVAKKHTHPLMRTPQPNREKRPGGDLDHSSDDAPKPSAMSKMRKLLQDERFQLQKLITQEKTRAFDDEIDLTVKQGQTVQLVAWIRFHSIYHAGKMHIRFLSRRSGPVILVMRPTEIVAADITCDIQLMKGKNHAPDIVKELLDPCISPEETSRYAFLLCDGVKWELVGCLSLQISNPSNPPEKTSSPVKAATPANNRQPPATKVPPRSPEPPPVDDIPPPPPDISPSSTPTKQVEAAPEPLPAISPETQKRLDAMEERRRVLEEKLERINSRLNFQPPKTTALYKPSKAKLPPWATPTPASNASKPPEDESSNPQAPSTPGEPSTQRKDPSESAAVPDHSIMADILPPFCHPPTFMTHKAITESRPSDYFASEQLIRLSLRVQESHKTCMRDFSNIAKRLYQQTRQNSSDPVSASTSPIPDASKDSHRVSEMSLIKDTNSFDFEDSSSNDHRDFQSIRIVPQQAATLASTTPTSSDYGPQSVGAQQPTEFGSPFSGVSITKQGNAGLPSTLFVRKLTPNGPSVLSTHAGNIVVPKIVATSSLGGVVPTSASSVLKYSTVPSQRSIAPKISSVSSMAFGNATPSFKLVQPDGQIIAAKPIIFPEAISVEISAVQMSNAKTAPLFNHRMKVVLEALTGEHEALCPTRTNMVLPLHSCDDEWSLVAVDPVPPIGLLVPGLQVMVPRAVLEKALSTAMERQARVSFPLHVQNIPSNPVLKKGFGVYATSQLPRHVFLGPFPANYLKSRPKLPVYLKLLAVAPESDDDDQDLVVDLMPTISSSLDDSIVIEKVVGPSHSSESPVKDECDAISIEPANGPASTDLLCTEKFTEDVFKSVDDNAGSPIEDSVFISTGTDAPSHEVEEIEDLTSGLNISISKVESTKQFDDDSENSDLEIVEDDYKGNEDLGSGMSDSDDQEYAPSAGKSWLDNETRWLESVAYLNRNSKSNSSLDQEQLSQDLVIEPVDSDSTRHASGSYQTESRKRTAEETVEDEGLLPRRSPKRTRRPTEKARMFAEELKAGRSSSASSQSSYSDTRRQASFSPPPSSRRSMFQRELHIRKEQERRGLLGKLFRDLDSLIAPNSGPRSKIVVLKHATNTLKGLEEQAKEMDNLYGLLKTRRNTLIRQRLKLYNELPSDVKPIFRCLLDSTPVPDKHLQADEMFMKRRRNSARLSEADGSQNGHGENVDHIDVTDY